MQMKYNTQSLYLVIHRLLLIPLIFGGLSGGELLCSKDKSSFDGLCLTQGGFCCSAIGGNKCTKELASHDENPPQIDFLPNSLSLIPDKNLICIHGFQPRLKNERLDVLRGIRIFVQVEQNAKITGQNSVEFMFDEPLSNQNGAAQLKNLTTCLNPGTADKLSEYRHDNKTYLFLELAPVPPSAHAEYVTYPNKTIAFSQLKLLNLTHKGCEIISMNKYQDRQLVNSAEKKSKEPNIGYIIGGIIAGCLLVIAPIGSALIWVCCKKRQSRRNAQKATRAGDGLENTPDYVKTYLPCPEHGENPGMSAEAAVTSV